MHIASTILALIRYTCDVAKRLVFGFGAEFGRSNGVAESGRRSATRLEHISADVEQCDKQLRIHKDARARIRCHKTNLYLLLHCYMHRNSAVLSGSYASHKAHVLD